MTRKVPSVDFSSVYLYFPKTRNDPTALFQQNAETYVGMPRDEG